MCTVGSGYGNSEIELPLMMMTDITLVQRGQVSVTSQSGELLPENPVSFAVMHEVMRFVFWGLFVFRHERKELAF